MALYKNGKSEEFFLFVCNFNMTLAASGMLETAAKVQYLCTLSNGDELCQFDSLSADMEGTNPLRTEAIIGGWVLIFSY